MIDTIILTIPLPTVVAQEAIKKHFTSVAQAQYGYYKKHYLGTQQFKDTYGYNPIITEMRRNENHYMHLEVELSIPKLLYSNNLYEVCENDFKRTIELLLNSLNIFQLDISETMIRTGLIKKVHYSKNIILPRGVTTSMLIAQLTNAELTRLEVSEKIYKNGGNVLYFSNRSFQLVFYNKRYELKKSTKGKKKEGSRNIQGAIAAYQDLLKNPLLEIFRMEAQLNTKIRILSEFKKHGWDELPTFETVFKEEKAEVILTDYWKMICSNLHNDIKGYNGAELFQVIRSYMGSYGSTMKVMAYLLLQDSEHYGVYLNSVKNLSQDRKAHKRLKKTIDALTIAPSSYPLNDLLKHISHTLETFTPLTKQSMYYV